MNLLSFIGTEGKKRSKEFSNKLKKAASGWDKQFWFKNPDILAGEHFYHSPAIILLGCVLWEDKVKKRINFSNKNVPALITSDQAPISKLLTPLNKVVVQNNSIQVFHQDSLLGFVQVPTILQNIISTIFKGVQKLNTVTGHRLIRLFVQSAFEQIINGHSDYRVIKNDRGASDIADLLGLKGGQHIANVKEIIHAMTFFYFQDSHINGNLIQLRKYKSPKTGRKDEGYEITIGTSLIPYRTFEVYRNGECGLLIPLLKDPPLVSPNQYYSGQYLLQMNLMGEFSKNSIQFFNEGVVELSQKKMREFAHSCGLTPEVLIKVLDRWTQDGDDGAKFLERVEDDFFHIRARV